ncbi:hypothetical protein LMG96_001242 [Escherichia coli]|nr:hypothetical protein [Escherichia coli]
MTALNKQAQAIISDIRLKRGSGDVYAPIIRLDEFEVITGALDAAEKRIAELEGRAVSIPEVRITVAESRRKNLTWRELGAYNEGADVAKGTILAAIRAAGIGVKGE